MRWISVLIKIITLLDRQIICWQWQCLDIFDDIYITQILTCNKSTSLAGVYNYCICFARRTQPRDSIYVTMRNNPVTMTPNYLNRPHYINLAISPRHREYASERTVHMSETLACSATLAPDSLKTGHRIWRRCALVSSAGPACRRAASCGGVWRQSGHCTCSRRQSCVRREHSAPAVGVCDLTTTERQTVSDIFHTMFFVTVGFLQNS